MSRPSKAALLAQENARNDALHRLMASLFEHEQAGELVPCVDPRRGHLWVSQHHTEQEAAAHGCASCPALASCRAYVTAHPEPAGVWAGVIPSERKPA